MAAESNPLDDQTAIGPPKWKALLTDVDWAAIAELLDLSPAQASFLWNALHDSRDSVIAERMRLSMHGAHAHRRAVFRKLHVDSMTSAIARVFATYIILRERKNAL